jgi:hypothetical protein
LAIRVGFDVGVAVKPVIAVGLDKAVEVAIGRAGVGVNVAVAVMVEVGRRVGVWVAVGVAVGGGVSVGVNVAEGVLVRVAVGLAVGVELAVGVLDGLGVGEAVGLGLGRVGVAVRVGVWLWLRLPSLITMASGAAGIEPGTATGGMSMGGKGAGIKAAAKVVGWGIEVEVGKTVNSLGEGSAATASAERWPSPFNNKKVKVPKTIRLRINK